jgi:hypothetical protein
VTAAGIDQSPPGAAPFPTAGPTPGWLRLARLYLVSRRIPAAVGLLAGLGAVLWAALHWHWDIAGGAAARLVVPLVVETGAAGVIAVTSYGPFGEPERATGRWLPYLRLGAAVGLTAVAVGVLAVGATGGFMPGGSLALLRNVAGMAGTGLLSAVLLGGALAWVGPMAYLLVTEGALAGGWTTPWIWAGRPPHDAGGAICAGLVFGAGIVLITIRGCHERVGE